MSKASGSSPSQCRSRYHRSTSSTAGYSTYGVPAGGSPTVRLTAHAIEIGIGEAGLLRIADLVKTSGTVKSEDACA
jgi:hypothetical protein